MNYFRPKKKKQKRDNKRERKEGRNVNKSNRRNQVLLKLDEQRGTRAGKINFFRTG